LLVAGSVIACGGANSDDGRDSGMPVQLTAIPNEFSPVPPVSAGAKLASRAASERDATDDYATSVTIKTLNDPELNQVDVISDLLQSLAQAKVVEHIDQGPYRAVVTKSLSAASGRDVQHAETWIVEAKTDDGFVRVRVWTQSEDPRQQARAQFKFVAAPRQDDDGSFLDYGTWHLDLGYGPGRFPTIALDVATSDDGVTTAKYHRVSGSGERYEDRAVFRRQRNAGIGRSTSADFSSCSDPGCATIGPLREVKYVYDASNLAVQTGRDAPVFKTRTAPVDVAYRYGLYTADGRSDVLRSKNFGFPLRIAGAPERLGFYSAWRGRSYVLDSALHPVPPATEVIRLDTTGTAGASYTVGPSRTGVLSRSTYVDSAIQELRDVVSQLEVNLLQTVRFHDQAWQRCDGIDAWFAPHDCATGWHDVAGPSVLASTPTITVFASLVNPTDQSFHTYQYRTGPDAGFYDVATSAAYLPQADDYFAAHSVGRRYITLTSTGWREKKVASSSFDGVQFVDGGDTDFTLMSESLYHLYVNGNWYSVTQHRDGSYTVALRVDTLVSAANVAQLLSATAILEPVPDTGSNGSTYRLDVDPASEHFLQLIYATVGTDDASQGGLVGRPVARSLTGLTASDGSQQRGTFDWDQNAITGTSTALIDSNGSPVALEDPMPFRSITLSMRNGGVRSYSVSFDGLAGQFSGLPNIQAALAQNGHVMTRELADTYVGVPAGTILIDARNAKSYITKPLLIVEYLPINETNPGNLDLAGATNIDLGTVPNYVDPGMGDAPAAVH
jgi:hypothetical protein